MKRIFSQDIAVVDNRFIFAFVALFAIITLLLVRLWYVQVYRGDHYRKLSELNRIRYIEVASPRGMIFDRYGKVVLGNRPYFDLAYIPQYVRDTKGTFAILSRLLHVPVSTFEKRLRMGRGLAKFLPISLKRNLSLHEVATIESNKIFLPGIDINVAPRRDYQADTPSHMVGYLGEISQKELKRLNERSPQAENTDPYRPGDLVGKQGLELRWEKYLRGKRGNRLIQVDAFGRQSDRLTEKISQGITLPHKPAIPGSDLVLTLDSELQRVTREAFKGKNGAVVVLDPRNGEILAMVSEPGYDPNIYQGVLSAEKYRSLLNNPFKPFLDKTTSGTYIPGSVYKAVVAAAALEERVVTPKTSFHCPGHFTLGNEVFHCHRRSGHGEVNLKLALMKSCDVYFYHVGVELGVDRIAKYAHAFGLGKKLGVRLNYELPGLIPTSAWKKLTHRVPWTKGETPNISIGQGAIHMSPMQMATLYATLGNEGKIWRPFLVKRVVNHIGETILIQDPELIGKVDIVKPRTFKLIKAALKSVVMHEDGTGKAAAVEGKAVAGKTGSVQVVSLKKNLTKLDVSMKWREHAMFASFSPVRKPEIALAVVSEHDKIGGGGQAAAPVAGKIIAAYWQLKAQRQGLKVGSLGSIDKRNKQDRPRPATANTSRQAREVGAP